MQRDAFAVTPALRNRFPALAQYLSEMVSIPGVDSNAHRGFALKEYNRMIAAGELKAVATNRYAMLLAVDVSLDSLAKAGFRMGRTPVTVRLWREYCQATRRKMPDAPPWGWIDNHPVVNVSQDDARAFCAWATAVGGVAVALPTEPAWEVAASGGALGQAYPWGERFEARYLWQGESRTGPVDRRERVYVNPYGLVDMAGNVWQWCEGAGIRGGSWSESDPECFRCLRDARGPRVTRRTDIGLRLVAPTRP